MHYLPRLLKQLIVLFFFAYSSLHAQTSFNISNKTSGDTLLTIDNDGKVGIGTTTPGASVDVVSSAEKNGSSMYLRNSNDSHWLYFYGGRGGASPLSPAFIWQEGDPLRFASFGAQYNEYMRISDIGNLGIGTNNPFAKLDIQMSGAGVWQRGIRLLNPELETGNQLMLTLGAFDNTNNSGNIYFNYQGNGSLQNRLSLGLYAVDDVLNIIADGNVGIGTTSPSTQLEVAGTIQSNSGGFMFPDGSVQTSAAGSGAGNTLDEAYDQGGAGEGRTITADNGAFEVGGVDGALFTGTYNNGTIPATGAGIRMMWYPRKAAFRTGRVFSTQWDDSNIGSYSNAMGYSTTASGSYSIALGFYTTASGVFSTAMGRSTTASGEVSTAIGQGIEASGSHAFAIALSDQTGVNVAQDSTMAIMGGYVGIGTAAPSTKLEVADTIYSSVGGFKFPDGTVQETAAGGGGAGNTLDEAYDQGGVGAGRTITADNGAFEVGGVDGALFTGTFSIGAIPAEGDGTRMMWYPAKAAFRAGRVGGFNHWDDNNIGIYSFATGLNTRASGSSSTAMGYYTTASAGYSTAMGNGTMASGNSAIAMGQSTTAGGTSSTAMGQSTTASGTSSTAMGYSTTASGDYSTAMGRSTTANGDFATAMGSGTIANIDYATATGYGTRASGTASTAMGYETNAMGFGSTSLGWSTVAVDVASTALGRGTTASGDYSTAMGRGIEAEGNYSVAIALSDQSGTIVTQNNTMAIMGGKVGIDESAPTAELQVGGIDGVLFTGTYGFGSIPTEGAGTRMMWYPAKAAFRVGRLDVIGSTYWDADNIGDNSFATGFETRASGNNSTAMGTGTRASGSTSTALGFNTTASNTWSTAMGNHTTASGIYSTAMGSHTTASGTRSTAMGSYVTVLEDGAFAIGDNSTTTMTTYTLANSFNARFANGFRLYTVSGPSDWVGARLGAGQNSWESISDSTKKENVQPVNSEEILTKIGQFKLGTWNYIGQDPAKFRHYGPMAQDFYAAFGHDGVGVIGNDTTLSSADFDGINFIAIQALEKRTTELKSENEQLKTEVALLKSKMEKFESLLQKIEDLSAINKQENQLEFANSK